MMDSPEIEEAKRNSIREITFFPKVKINNEYIEPCIVIDMKDGKAKVFLNAHKLYRTLNNKNLIQQSLDILLVDTINKHLENMAIREKEFFENLEKGGGDDARIFELKGTRGNSEESGQSGSEEYKDSTERERERHQ